jgi:hypothetical protein
MTRSRVVTYDPSAPDYGAPPLRGVRDGEELECLKTHPACQKVTPARKRPDQISRPLTPIDS